MKKKFMSFVLTLCLMSVMTLTAFADDVATFGGSATRSGDTITVTLTVDQAGATSGQIELGYDEEFLTLVSASFGTALTDALTDVDHADSINTAETGVVTAGFASLTAADAGEVLIVVFEVTEETTEGEYSFPYAVEEWSKATTNDLLEDAKVSKGAIVLSVDGGSVDVVDKTELQASSDEAGELIESDYTADSWAALQEALADAAAVLADENATQEEVDEANAALQAAIAALVKADAEEDTTTAELEDGTTAADDETTAAEDETTAADDETAASSDDEDETTTTVAGSNGDSTLGTGDRNLTALWVIAFAALIGAAALVVAGKKKRA